MNEKEPSGSGEGGCSISLFDYSVENHLKAVDSISNLCGEAGAGVEMTDINRLSSSVTLLRDWRHFSYEPKSFGFYNEAGKSCEPKDINSHTLPQFSSARAPKVKIHDDESSSSAEPSKDFIMHVGGSVWALEWCPRVHGNPDAQAKCEFLAVATHPPQSYSHKIGVRLSGRGIIQIWCVINATCENGSTQRPGKNQKLTGKFLKKQSDESREPKKPRGRPRKRPVEATEPKKPRGRPRKKSTSELPIEADGDVPYVEPLSVRHPEEPVVPATPLRVLRETSVAETNTNNKSSGQVLPSETANIKLPVRRKKQKTQHPEETCKPVLSEDSEAVRNVPGEPSSNISEDIALPRVVLCLAHNGKVAWDMKWRPPSADDSLNKHRMGYLAVLLGNGSLEVWDVPVPQAISALYLSSKKDATDPRFVKLAPVFKCTNLKCGDSQSIPLTVEWSTFGNPDFLLAGCHDGTVALWKFSMTKSSEDTRPLLFFSADTSPIRAIAWAPVESDQESANIVATAGHGGLKFWDLRDPFRPLWDLHPVPRFIYSLDWLQDPKCVLLSYDDGTIRVLSLVKVAYDVPATGKPYPNTKQQGLSVYNCSSFPIWSIQASRLTGMAAYCTADGSVFHFQLTTKAVEKDSRNRTPHFLCGRLTMNDSTFTVHSPVPNKPIVLKKPVGETGEKQRCLRSLLNESPNRYASPVSDVQPLAFANDEDPGFETEGANNKASKSKAKKGKSNTIEDENRGALVCVKEDGDEEEGRRKEASNSSSGVKAERFPPKMVAMHRVRWNMNKGSERWVCYGGAAGIVRCQEIASSGSVGKPNLRPQR